MSLSLIANKTFSRRRVLMSLPATTLLAVSTNAYATPGEASDIELKIPEPTLDSTTFEIAQNTPIFSGTSRSKVLQRAALPERFIVTNRGSQKITELSGTISTQMRDKDTDVPSVGAADKLQMRPLAQSGVSWSQQSTGKNGENMYSWKVLTSLEAGESISVEFEYFVGYPFANVDFEVLINATVQQGEQIAQTQQVSQLGTVPGFARYV